MELKLLTPPSDSPSRLPLTRGLPSEASFAVDTGALPRSLPQTMLDPSVGTAPLDALARLGATGVQVASNLETILLETEARKRNADDLAEATGLYTQTALKFDAAFEKLKVSSDHNTLRPAFDATWNELAGEALNGATNANVKQALGLKLAGLRVSKSAEVSDVTRRKFVDYHESILVESAGALERQASDPEATPPDVQFAVRNIRSLFEGYAHQGIFPPDKLAALESRYLTNIGNTRAQQAMTANPEAFLPKSVENPDGQGGYRAFGASGQTPADAKYLATLVDTTGPRMLETQRREKRLDGERKEKAFDAQMANAHQQKYDQLLIDLDSGDPQKVRNASIEVPQAILDSGLYWSDAKKAALLALARNTRVQGGVTNDRVYNDLHTRMLENPASVPQDEILHNLAIGQLAATGDRSASSLMEKARTLGKGDDISQTPAYRVGHSILTAALGGSNALTAAAMFSPTMKISDIAAHRDAFADALTEYDRRARDPNEKQKNLRELAVEISDAYQVRLYRSLAPRQDAAPSGGARTNRERQ